MRVRDALERYKTDHLDALKNGRERYLQLARCLRKYQNKSVSELTNADLSDSVKRWSGGTRNRYRAAITHFFTYCRSHDWTVLQPTILPGKEKPRDVVLSLDQLRALYRAAPYQGKEWAQFLQLLILTGQRPSDLMRFCPTRIQGQDMHLPTSKNGTSHIVPLAPHAFVLGAMQPNMFCHFKTTAHVKKRWFQDAYVPTKRFRIQDIRRSFATHLAEDGQDENDIDRILNHQAASTARGVQRTYNRSRRLAQRRAIMERWEDLLLKDV